MAYTNKDIPQVGKVFKEYGIDATGASIEIVDEYHDRVSLLVTVGMDKYFIAADDALYDEDEVYLEQARPYTVSVLEPIKLLKPDRYGEEYATLFGESGWGDTMVCKVFKAT